jgi:hypothetical protein
MSFIQTYPHRISFDLLDPQPSMIRIEDIAHALSMMCRFGGHLSQHYSVAQHSILVSRIVPQQFALEGLLHDAEEAYTGDMVSPLKRHNPVFRQIADRIKGVIYELYQVPYSDGEAVHYADRVALSTEARDLRPGKRIKECRCGDECPLNGKIKPWSQEFSRYQFLRRFNELFHGGNPIESARIRPVNPGRRRIILIDCAPGERRKSRTLDGIRDP